MTLGGLLLCLPALAGKPVAKPVRGGLDERVVTKDVAGVLVQFDGATKTDAEGELDAAAKKLKLVGGLRVGFFKTDKATLAAVYVVAPGTVTVKGLKEVAAECSRMAHAKAAWAFLHPGATDTELEVEGWWRFEAGQPVAQKRLAFRDDDSWVQWNRRRLSDADFQLKKWPGWPLSELAIALGLPGRDFLERTLALLDLSTWDFPRDVGANQVIERVYLPAATLLELRQHSETTHASVSKLVEDAIIAADGAGELGVAPQAADRAPWDDEMPESTKSPPRELALFLTQEVWGRVDAKMQALSVSESKLVEYAWRREHPWSAKKKAK